MVPLAPRRIAATLAPLSRVAMSEPPRDPTPAAPRDPSRDPTEVVRIDQDATQRMRRLLLLLLLLRRCLRRSGAAPGVPAAGDPSVAPGVGAGRGGAAAPGGSRARAGGTAFAVRFFALLALGLVVCSRSSRCCRAGAGGAAPARPPDRAARQPRPRSASSPSCAICPGELAILSDGTCAASIPWPRPSSGGSPGR